MHPPRRRRTSLDWRVDAEFETHISHPVVAGLSTMRVLQQLLRRLRASAGSTNRQRRCRSFGCSTEQLETRALPTLNIVFDYSRDTSGLFNSVRQARLNQAAADFEQRLDDTLTAITPSGTNTWTARFTDPFTGQRIEFPNLRVPQNQLRVYVIGTNQLPASAPGFAGSGGFAASGTNAWLDVVQRRGQPANQFSTWGGYIYFSTNATWHDAASTSGLEGNEIDFLSVAIHELAHVLGYGDDDVFAPLVVGGRFTGARSRAVYGQNVPMSADLAHWADGTLSDGRETAMDPSIVGGERKTFTTLDWAALQDIGWMVDFPPRLGLTISPGRVSEGDPAGSAVGRVTRSGSTAAALRVTLASSDTTEAIVPGAVTIPAGQNFVEFDITPRDDSLFDGTQTVTVTASATAAVNSAQRTLQILDDEVPEFTITPAVSRFVESAGAAATTATVTRTGPTTSALTVALRSLDTSEATVQRSVVIPAGAATSPPFPINAVDDTAVDGPQTVTITANATGSPEATRNIVVLDDERPTLSVLLSANSADENAGSTAVTVRVRRNGPTTTALSVSLVSSDPTAVRNPGIVTIPAGQNESGEVALVILDDQLFDGNQAVTITATAPGTNSGQAILNIIDDEIPELALTISPGSFSESAGPEAAFGTVSRTGPTVAAVTINLASTDVSEARVPATVVIAAGDSTSQFPIDAIDDSQLDGTQSVEVRATGTGFAGPASRIFTVTDNELPTLTIVPASSAIPEEGRANAGSFVVRRNGPTSTQISVQLQSSDPQVHVPTSTLIPSGSRDSDSIPIRVIDDRTLDGNTVFTLTADSQNAISGSRNLTVVDNEVAPRGYFDIDQDGLWNARDQVLWFRALIGSPNIPAGQLAINSQRWRHATISGWAEDNLGGLDVDGDGQLEADDFLLAYRYTQNIRGDELIDTAVDGNGSRNTLDEILTYLDILAESTDASQTATTAAQLQTPTVETVDGESRSAVSDTATASVSTNSFQSAPAAIPAGDYLDLGGSFPLQVDQSGLDLVFSEFARSPLAVEFDSL